MENNIAVYWDFENIHASRCSINYKYNRWYNDHRSERQPYLVDINSIMEYVASLGNVNINKAYCNWTFFGTYNSDLQDHSVDLIQLYPRGPHGKNGADIRMAIDVIEDLSLNPHITTVVLIGGDSDYIAIAQKVRQKGKSIIGIGTKESTNPYLIKACNEFKFYSSLLVKSASANNLKKEGYEESDVEEARELLSNALNRILSRSGEEVTKKANVKPMMMRLDPSFDETNYGFSTFGDFLKACNDLVKVERGQHDHMISFKTKVPQKYKRLSTVELSPYERILNNYKIRLPRSGILHTGIYHSFEIFNDNTSIRSFDEFRHLLFKRLSTDKTDVTEADVSKIKSILSITSAFEYDSDSSTYRIDSNIGSADKLLNRVLKLLVRRLLANVQENLDCELISEMIFGTKEKADDIESIVGQVKMRWGQ